MKYLAVLVLLLTACGGDVSVTATATATSDSNSASVSDSNSASASDSNSASDSAADIIHQADCARCERDADAATLNAMMAAMANDFISLMEESGVTVDVSLVNTVYLDAVAALEGGDSVQSVHDSFTKQLSELERETT